MAAPRIIDAPAAYSRGAETTFRAQVREELARCFQRDEEVQPVRLVLQDTVTGERYEITVASGALTATLL